ncbi:MAG: hypothetical protein AAF840_04080 [Bacteroidota bacterium]
MSEQNHNWNALGEQLREYQDNGGDWAANYARLREEASDEPSFELGSFSKLSLILGMLLMFSIWGNAYQYGRGAQPKTPPCPSFTDTQPTQHSEVMQQTVGQEAVAVEAFLLTDNDAKPVSASTISQQVLLTPERADRELKVPAKPERPLLSAQEDPVQQLPLPTMALAPALAVSVPKVVLPTPKKPEQNTAQTEPELSQEIELVVPDEALSVVAQKAQVTVPALAVAPYHQHKVEHPKPLSLLSAYRVGALDLHDVVPRRRKWLNLTDVGTDLSVDAGLRVSGGFPYQVGGGPSLTAHARLAYHLLSDADGSPIGLELGFFQGRPSWLGQDNVLYRTQQPASLLLDGAPAGATVQYEVYNAWGIELGMSEYSELTHWLGIRTRLGLSILSYQQRFEQVSGGEPIDFSIAPQLAQPIGMYWNVGPELRFGKQGHLRLSYHGLVGNNARKAYFPGRNNGLEGVEFGLGWGF